MIGSPSTGGRNEGKSDKSPQALPLFKMIDRLSQENHQLEQTIIRHLSSQSMGIQKSTKSNKKVSQHFQLMYSNALKSIQKTTTSIKDLQTSSEDLVRQLQGKCEEKQCRERDIWNAFCEFRRQVFMDARDSKKAKALKLKRLEELERQEEEVGW
jgi:hypothetical protein